MSYYDQVREAADAIRPRVPEIPAIAIVLGSGLGDFAHSLGDAVTMPYAELPHWPASRVVGHAGTLVIGKARGKTVAALAGRCHLYEGHDVGRVAFATRVLGLLGVKTLILTNAAGGVNRTFSPGDIMVITDQINLTLERPSIPRGTRSADLYHREFVKKALVEAERLGIPLMQGVYAGVKGPSYETAAEIDMIAMLLIVLEDETRMLQIQVSLGVPA